MLEQAISAARPRPLDASRREEKQGYASRLSTQLATQLAADLRQHGLKGCLPDPQGCGVEREFAGGIGAKKVDVSWSADWAGLLLGISIKTINFPDSKTHNYQKNLTNRRGDMLFESVTLHRRFPYAVLGGFLFLHEGAERDGTSRRESTFVNAHSYFRIFTGRYDPGARDEQLERVYVALYEDVTPSIRLYQVGESDVTISWDRVRDDLLQLVADRNPDHFVFRKGRLDPR